MRNSMERVGSGCLTNERTRLGVHEEASGGVAAGLGLLVELEISLGSGFTVLGVECLVSRNGAGASGRLEAQGESVSGGAGRLEKHVSETGQESDGKEFIHGEEGESSAAIGNATSNEIRLGIRLGDGAGVRNG